MICILYVYVFYDVNIYAIVLCVMLIIFSYNVEY